MCDPFIGGPLMVLAGGGATAATATTAAATLGSGAAAANMAAAATTLASSTSVLGGVASFDQQSKNAVATAEAAGQAKAYADEQTNLREAQEALAAAEKRSDISLEVAQRQATAEVSAQEAGVGGSSVDALLGSIRASGLTQETRIKQNLEMSQQQLAQQRRANLSQAQSRINQVSRPSLLATGLQIGSNVADIYRTA